MNYFGKNLLKEIEQQIKDYTVTNKGKTPSYIIINENDTEQLLNEMYKAKFIPNTKPPKNFILFSQRVIRTTDIPERNFDVVGA